MENNGDYICETCYPDLKIYGEVIPDHYLAYDESKNEWWLSNSSYHHDCLIFKFGAKPELDPLNLIDEPENKNDVLYDQSSKWIDEINLYSDTFIFNPITGHALVEAATQKGWKREVHGFLLLYIVHQSAELIKNYETKNDKLYVKPSEFFEQKNVLEITQNLAKSKMQTQRTMSFILNEDDLKKIEKWEKTLPSPESHKSGINYTFTSGGGIGYGIIVKRDDGHEINISDVSKW